jgi:predicted MPP superfamily phosphohydrolase
MSKSDPKPKDLPRPNIYLYHNPLMHTIGKFVRGLSNRFLSVFDDGVFRQDGFEINHLSIPYPALPSEFVGYRILQISDIHLGTWMNEKRLQGIVEMAHAQSADAIVITGDFVTHMFDGVTGALERCLKHLSAPDGVLAVLGNHDYWAGEEQVLQVLERCQIIVLRNQVHAIKKNGQVLKIAGLDDVYNARDDLSKLMDQLSDNIPAILLVHVPDFADLAAATGKFALELSGHSHGGQIVLPLIGAPVLPPLGRKYPRGLYRINGMYHYTSKGTGTATIPFRFDCPPEITVFTLTQSTVTEQAG